MKKLAIVLCLCAASSGPAFAGKLPDPLGLFPDGDRAFATNTDPISALRSFTVDDLTAAKADADAQNPPDVTASRCYEALFPVVSQAAGDPLPKSLGAFQAFQKARDLANAGDRIRAGLTGGPINDACAPLVLSARNTVLMLAASVGVKFAPK